MRRSVLILIALTVTFSLSGCRRVPATTTATFTATPAPSPERFFSQTDIPPRLLTHVPARGAEHKPDAPLVLRFSQAMDMRATANAFNLKPHAGGRIGWADPATLVFTPTEPLLPDTRYRVSVDEGARSAAGLPLLAPAVFHFTTPAPLSVTQVSPPPDATDVLLEGDVMVVFNRPVTPLTLDALRDSSVLPHPLTFDPPVEGEGEWVNTATYVFHPKRLEAGTTYRVRVRAGLADLTGVTLGEDYQWAFTTLFPAVLETFPVHLAHNVPPDVVLRITFNQPMAQRTGNLFTLRDPQGNPVPGRLRWADATTLVFTPTNFLARETTYTAHLDEVPNAAGSKTAPAYEWTFSTLPHFRFIGSNPSPGPVDVSDSNDLGYPGQLFLEFSAPVNTEDVSRHLRIEPAPATTPRIWHSRYPHTQVGMAILQPDTVYTLTIDGALTDQYGEALGQDVVLRFYTLPFPPIVYLNIDHPVGLLRADEPAIVYVAHRNISRVDLTLYRREPERVLTCAQQRKPPKPCYPADLSSLPPYRTWSQTVSPITTTTAIPIDLAEGGLLPPGIYALTVSEPSADQEYRRRCENVVSSRPPYCYPPRSQTLIVANGHILLRSGLQKTFAWATDLCTGEPLAGRTILVPRGEELYTAVTGADGTATLPAGSEWAFIIEGGTFAVGHSGWDRSPWEWSWNWPRGWYEPDYYNGFHAPQATAVYLYTDRPLYRPGDTVYFKGIFRVDDGLARYHLTFPPALDVTIQDSLDQEVYRQSLSLTPLGTFSGTLTLESYAPLGVYKIVTCSPYYPRYCYGVPFRVAAYRPPEFEVTISADKDAYFPGETAQMQVEARYYFGEPVPHAVVDWEWRNGRFEVLEKGSGRTDARGRFILPRPLETGGTFHLIASVRDAAGQTVGGHGSVQVQEAGVRVTVAVDRVFLAAGEAIRAAAQVVDLEGVPLAGQPVTLTLFHWGIENETAVFTANVTTDAQGWSGASFILPSGGRYRLMAIAADPIGRPAAAETVFWATGLDPAWPADAALLITDRDSYTPGDTARLLISNPWPGPVQALLSVERGDVLEHRVLLIPPGGATVEWPIQPQHAPNIFFAVTLIPSAEVGRPAPGVLLGAREVKVSLVERTLRLELVVDPPQAQPGQVVTWTVRATDWQGNPARVELSLALVDKAVLSLDRPNAPNPLDAFYPARAHGIRASAGLRFPAARADLLTPARYYLEDMGIGGGGEDGLWGDTQVRQRFQGTALWTPAIQTDGAGVARVQVALPDNITTWLMDARAVDGDTRVGYATAELVASKPFLVRPITPRFLVVGDRVELGATVHNATAVPLSATVVISATGLILENPPMQTLSIPAQGEATALWNAQVLMGEAAHLLFRAVADHPDLGRLADASYPPVGVPPDQHLPVYHYSVPETVGAAGQLTEAGERLEGILLPTDLDVGQGELTVRLDPSLAGAVVHTLRARDYAYWTFPTAEQVASRLLPNLFTYRAIREGGLNAPHLELVLVPLIREDLSYARLLQHDDGGWGWLRSDPSSPVVSAQLLFALVHARRLGFDVEQGRIERAIHYLQGQVSPPDTVDQPNHQAIILHALAEAGAGDEAALAALATKRQRLQYYARALLLLAFARTNPQHPAVSTILSDLTSAVILSATGAHWEEEGRPDYWAMNTDTRTTAIVLDALVHTSPSSDLVPNAARWLMVARKADGTWETSQETAWSLIALTDWLMASGELHPDYSWEVTLNERRLARGHATHQNVLETQVLRVAVADLLRDTANRLAIRRGEGPGRLYYTAHLRVFRPVEAVTPINRGIFVAREYTSLMEPDRPITATRVGELVQAKLVLVAPHDLHYVVVEDPFPAGCEPVDPTLRNAANPWQSFRYRSYEGGSWWLNHVELRDEKVVVMATYLPRGTYEIRYTLQATRPGRYHVLPPSASETFFPEVFGHGAGSVLIVREAE